MLLSRATRAWLYRLETLVRDEEPALLSSPRKRESLPQMPCSLGLWDAQMADGKKLKQNTYCERDW